MLKKKNRKVKHEGATAATDSCDDIDMGNSTMEADDTVIVEEVRNPKATKFLKKKGKSEDHMPLLPGVSPQQVVKQKLCSKPVVSASNGKVNGMQSLSPILPVTECREM